jgi:Tfp pilus tip-associated adhesin PilY1
MKSIQLVLLGLFVALMSISAASKAEDIDIYSGLGGAAGKPNVLIVFDNAANFSSNAAGSTCIIDGVATALSGTVGGIEQCAFYSVISALPTDSSGNALINIGMMVYNANNIRDINEANCGGSNGGCLVQPLIPMDAAHKAPLLAWIKTWRTSGGAGTGYIKSAGEATAATMQEAWAYYAGSTGLSGRSYTGIQPAAGCQQNFVIFIGNSFSASGTPGDGGSTSPAAALASAPGITTAQQSIITTTNVTSCGTYTFPTSAHENKGFYADEWARYMRQADIYSTIEGTQKITTYTIGLLGPSCQAEYAATLTSMANVGGGKYFATTDYVSITQALLKILNEVQAVNSVFSSSSLPVSVNAQGTYLNQIYMGMFRPDTNGQPRWLGNLKQYQFNYDVATGNLSLGDKDGNGAISAAGTGFISPNAVSFWTSKNLLAEPDLGGGFWRNVPLPNGAGAGYDSPDGELVEKGGAAQVMRLANLVNDYSAAPASSTNPRKLYTYCPSGTCTAQLSDLVNTFDSSNTLITDAMLGTGARTITSIASAVPTTATSAVAGTTVSAVTVSITAFSKSSSTVTATVSAADLAHISVGASITISTGAAKYDCTPCTVGTVGTTTFTYSKSGGSGTPSVPYIATVASTTTTSTSVEINKVAHGLAVGQKVTFSTCSVLMGLNGQVVNITAITADTFTVSAPSAMAGTDTACHYTPNTATVTSVGHGFPSGAVVTIASASPGGYNGSWTITVTGADTFTYQYTVAAPLSAFSGSATATSSTTTRTNLTQWVRGYDNNSDELSPGGTINIRPSVHGDVLHSRPTVVNYGGTTGVVVFYGANDGVFRAINGNQANPTGSTLTAPGSELWGFIPSEFYGKLRRLHDNSPVLSLPTTPPGIIPTPKTKDYFVDGSTGVYQFLNSDGTTNTAYLYLAMRRGGRFLYALDISAPTNPQYLWKISNTGDFTELGQTWSQPKVAKVKGYTHPVLIFGAGYDTAEDSEPSTADTMGRGIFIVDAITGAMVWSAKYGAASGCSGTSTNATCAVSEMKYSIPADITLVDRDSDGKIDRLYATDTGGNVWRVDLQPTVNNITYITPDHWQVNKIAALGCSTGACAAGTTPRKFFYPADVVLTNSYDVVLVGSGDREHPRYSNLSYSISNRFYMLKDSVADNGSGLTTITHSNLFDATSTTYDGTLKGFYITLDTGEKVVNAPTTVSGYTYFGTNQPTAPSANSCTTNLGIARGYSIKFLTGAFTYTEFDGGGLPPSPVSGLVNISVLSNGVSTTKLVPFLIGGGSGGDSGSSSIIGSVAPCVGGTDSCSNLGGIRPQNNVKTSRHRAYWYKN